MVVSSMIMKNPSTVTSSTGQGLRFDVVISKTLLMTDYSLNPAAKFLSPETEHLVSPFVGGLLRGQPDRREHVHQHSAGEERSEHGRRRAADLTGHLHQPIPAEPDFPAHVVVGAGGVRLHLKEQELPLGQQPQVGVPHGVEAGLNL